MIAAGAVAGSGAGAAAVWVSPTVACDLLIVHVCFQLSVLCCAFSPAAKTK